MRYYVGIDVSKGYADFVILDEKMEVVIKNFQLDDTYKGHCHLKKILKERVASTAEDIKIYSAVESTGGYEDNWYNSIKQYAKELPIKIMRLNPVGIHAQNKAAKNKNITDKISARNIAEYMIRYPEKITFENNDAFATLRKQWNFAEMLKKQKAQLLNYFESVLYIANPEVAIYCKTEVPQWALKLLEKYPTAQKLSSAKTSALIKIQYITKERAKSLIKQAKTSVASSTDEITEQTMSNLASQILSLMKTIAINTKKMISDLDLPEIELLKSIPGLGDHSAVGLFLEIGDIKRFSSAKQLASYFGLHPTYKMSGDGVGKIRMSKEGRKVPRRILFLAVLRCISRETYINDLYKSYLKKEKSKMSAIGICMHKMCRIIFGVLTKNEKFNSETDIKNRNKKYNKKKVAKPNQTRRYQPEDSNAPISRRQTKKRKEQASQDANLASNTGLPAQVV